MKKTIKKLPKSEVAIEVTIPQEVFESYRVRAVKNAGEHLELPGFRKGKAPAEIVEKNLVPMALLEEMADLAINEHLPKILVDEKLDAIGRPLITITKIAGGNDLEFTASVAVLPEIKLPDYKKIAGKENSSASEASISDEELEEAIKELKKARAHDAIHKSGEKHDHHEFEKQEFDSVLTEEYVKELGPFESVADFKEKFRANLKLDKENQNREKRRIAILESIAKETDVELPNVLIENELEQLLARLKGDIAQAGIPFEEYLKHIKKTEEDLKKDLFPDAEKKSKVELILIKIGEAENLKPKEEDVESETKRLVQTYQDADPLRARAYIAHMLMNEVIFKFLEEQK